MLIDDESRPMGFYRPLVQLKLNRFVNQLVLGRIGKPEETNHVRREERGSKLEGKRNKTLVHHVDLNAPMFFRPKLSAHHKVIKKYRNVLVRMSKTYKNHLKISIWAQRDSNKVVYSEDVIPG